jgi:hypothetical protein
MLQPPPTRPEVGLWEMIVTGHHTDSPYPPDQDAFQDAFHRPRAVGDILVPASWATGNILIWKAFVVVSSKQQAWNTVLTVPNLANSLNPLAWEWAASKSTRCPWLPMHQTGFGLQLDSGDYVLGWLGCRKCLKSCGGPGRVRTVDLFHAMADLTM